MLEDLDAVDIYKHEFPNYIIMSDFCSSFLFLESSNQAGFGSYTVKEMCFRGAGSQTSKTETLNVLWIAPNAVIDNMTTICVQERACLRRTLFSPKSSAVWEVAVGFDTGGDDPDFCDQHAIRKAHHIHVSELEEEKRHRKKSAQYCYVICIIMIMFVIMNSWTKQPIHCPQSIQLSGLIKTEI